MKCAGCGSSHFLRKTPVAGYWVEHYDSEIGESLESDTNGLTHGRTPKTMKCAECGKSAPNPDYKKGSA